jgi:glycosyltransferase involved in cell wall biosynthesis
MKASEPRVALVHDFLLDLRGGERVFLALCELFPDADLFTAVYDPVGTEGRFAHRNVHASFLQRLRPNASSFRRLLPLYPYAMEALDLSGYDLVLSSSSAWAHGVLPSADAVHVCYCHNPFRYAWNERDATLRAQTPVVRAGLGVVLKRWRQWDWIAAQRVDRYIANSETTRRRIARYFTREAEVVYPPVEIERFAPGVVGEHYVVLSELMSHKRIELAVRAFNRLGRPLVVIGDGPDARRLQRLAGPAIRFTGRVSDAEVARLLATSRALVVTATEEFGIAAVEAQAAGRPVIALDEGGVTESVQEGRTGVFYETATPEALAEAVAAFDPLSVDPADCVANAQRFGADAFAQEIRAIVGQALAAGPSPRGDRRRPARGLALAGRRAA